MVWAQRYLNLHPFMYVFDVKQLENATDGEIPGPSSTAEAEVPEEARILVFSTSTSYLAILIHRFGAQR